MIPSSQHPLPHATGVEPWRVHPHNPRAGGPAGRLALWGWRLEDGAVVLQSDDGDVTIPQDCLTSVANGLLAVHVHNGRPDAGAVPTKGTNVGDRADLNNMSDSEKADMYAKQVEEMKDRAPKAPDQDRTGDAK